jgi:hypothetical protein
LRTTRTRISAIARHAMPEVGQAWGAKANLPYFDEGKTFMRNV